VYEVLKDLKKGSHFHPDSDLFVPSEKKNVITSTVCWSAMAALLAGLTFFMGPAWIIKFYVIPYWVITLLNFHHGLPINCHYHILGIFSRTFGFALLLMEEMGRNQKLHY